MDNRRQSGLWAQNPQTGFYEKHSVPAQPGPQRQYYHPSSPTSAEPRRRSYSEHAGLTTAEEYDGIFRSDSASEHDDGSSYDPNLTHAPLADILVHGGTTSEQFAQTKHVNSTWLPGSLHQERLDTNIDGAPITFPPGQWSPESATAGASVQDGQVPMRHASDPSGVRRRGSVPHRSPLQQLEGRLDSISKAEKRARVLEAEQKSRKTSLPAAGYEHVENGADLPRSATLRSEKGRSVSDGSRVPSGAVSGQYPVARSFVDERDKAVTEPVPDRLPGLGSQNRSQDGHHSSQAAAKATLSGASLSSRHKDPQFANVPKPYYDASAAPHILGIRREPQPYYHAPEAPRWQLAPSTHAVEAKPGVQRSASESREPQVRDTDLAGASIAQTDGTSDPNTHALSPAERGRLAHERRKAQESESQQFLVASDNTDTGANATLGGVAGVNGAPIAERRSSQTGLSLGQAALKTSDSKKVQRSGLASVPPESSANKTPSQRKRIRFSDLLHGDDRGPGYMQTEPPLQEWRYAQVARLTLSDLDFDHDLTEIGNDSAKNPRLRKQRNGPERTKAFKAAESGGPGLQNAQYDGSYEEKATMFRPQLFLTCGPLLRYTGLRRERLAGQAAAQERAVWRGSVMIVTEDAQSDLSTTPTLTVFAQPMNLLQSPPKDSLDKSDVTSLQLQDPIAGQVKLSRTGRPLYVRPVHDIEGAVDLSREESNSGLYSAIPVSPSIKGRDWTTPNFPHSDKSRIRRDDGQKAGRYRQVKGARLHTERGFTFWRFCIEIELGTTQRRVAYRINDGPAIGFWVPGRSSNMNIMFHSCNGFSLSVNSHDFSGPDPLWRDVLNKHQFRPFHVMIGGGDQIYNDAAMQDTQHFGDWIGTKKPELKHSAQFTPEMQNELEDFYLHRYMMWFSQGLFAMAGSQIPMVNVWDDHDIIDGYGSYPHRLMASRVFTGLGAVAYKYYMLFQHHSVAAETEKDEPSWILGASPGPYINELSRSLFLDMGPHIKFLGIDCRTERMRDEVVSQETYDLLFERCEKEIVRGETKHLIVLLGVPIAYPRLNFLENILTSRVMDPVKAMGRTGMLGGFVNKFDGGVEILDDLDDHWTAKHHKGERNWFIQELQDLAAEKSVRITILGGDVHLGAVGRFYTARKLGVAKDKDHRYMPNVISSAIVNTPPPTMMADVLNRRNRIHHLDVETDEDLVPMFECDVDGSKRNNRCLLPRRNYCIIREYTPGSTPPATPSYEQGPTRPAISGSYSSSLQEEEPWDSSGHEGEDRRFPPGSMRRTMSLGRSGASGLIRRLSGSTRSRNPPSSLGRAGAAPGMGRSNSLSDPVPGAGDSYFPLAEQAVVERPTSTFHRRPTDLSGKDVRRAAAKEGEPNSWPDGGARPPLGHIDLQGGLDISLSMEIDQRDPGGHTREYRLLVPALFYDGADAPNNARFKTTQRASFVNRLKSVRRRKEIEDDEGTRSQSPSPSGVEDRSPQQQRSPPEHSEPISDPAPMQTKTRAYIYGADAVYEQRSTSPTAAPKVPNDGSRANTQDTYDGRFLIEATYGNTKGAYDRGYNLSGPPIGAGHLPPGTDAAAAPAAGNAFPSWRGANDIDAHGTHATSGREGTEKFGTEGTASPSEIISPLRSHPPQRTASKAERLLGFDAGPAAGAGGDATEEGNVREKRKPAWKIWA